MADKMLHQFKSTIPSCKFILSNGKNANFVGGIYRTDLEHEVAELQNEVKQGHPHIEYIGQISAADLDPVAVLKRKAIAEYLAEQKAAIDPSRDMGTSTSGPVTEGMVNSTGTTTGIAGAQEQQKDVATRQPIKVNLSKQQ
jgi:hypothetical protein